MTRRALTGALLLAAVTAAALWWPRETDTPLEAAPGGTAAAQTRSAPPAASTTSAPTFDGARAFDHLKQLVAIGPRPAGSPQIRQTRAYVTRQVSALGLTVQEQPFTADTPQGRVEMVNLAVRLPGRRPERILLAGHYDTKALRNQVFVGANDGGSSAAFLIELLRVLKDRPREFTYEFVWLDGEEAFCPGWTDCGTPTSPDHTYGSRYYVQASQRAGSLASIRALLLVDMIGDTDLQIRRDTNSTRWLNDEVWNSARRLGYGRIFVDAETAIEDDHLPFLQAGVPAIDIIDLDYPYWHTPDDTLAHVSARSLQAVGDVVVDALPAIERRLAR